jgi:hypothetical protein
MATASVATLRSKIEDHLRGRVPAPFAYRDRNVFELVSTGIWGIDAFVGGLPRGALTEICGAACSGRTSLLVSALASRTAQGEVCALVDARDSFDPVTANAAGVDLKKVLWVRCQNIEQALRATDLLIQAGGFGLVAVDLSDVPAKTVRGVPLNAWFRFRRAVEETSTILMVLEQEANAKTCASLVLRLEARETQWVEAKGTLTNDANENAEASLHVPSIPSNKLKPIQNARHMSELPAKPGARKLRPAKELSATRYPFTRLLQGFQIGANVVRSRLQSPLDPNVVDFDAGAFELKTMWSFR